MEAPLARTGFVGTERRIEDSMESVLVENGRTKNLTHGRLEAWERAAIGVPGRSNRRLAAQLWRYVLSLREA